MVLTYLVRWETFHNTEDINYDETFHNRHDQNVNMKTGSLLTRFNVFVYHYRPSQTSKVTITLLTLTENEP